MGFVVGYVDATGVSADGLGNVYIAGYSDGSLGAFDGSNELGAGGIEAFIKTYDAAGNLTVITDPLGNATHNQYDVYGFRKQLVDADGHVVNFTNDANGNLLFQTEADGRGWSLTYTCRPRLPVVLG